LQQTFFEIENNFLGTFPDFSTNPAATAAPASAAAAAAVDAQR